MRECSFFLTTACRASLLLICLSLGIWTSAGFCSAQTAATDAPFLASAMSGDLVLSVNALDRQDSFANAYGDTTRPQYGKYLLLTVTVVDKGEKALKLDPKMFAIRDNRGRQFAPNALSDRKLFFEALHPGQPVTGRLVFDVPEDSSAPKLVLRMDNGKTALVELVKVRGNSMSGPGAGSGRATAATAQAEGNATRGMGTGAQKGPGTRQSGGAPLGTALAGSFNFAVTGCERRQSYRDAFYEWVTSSVGTYLLVDMLAQNMDTAPHGLQQGMFSVRDAQGRQYAANPMSDRKLFAREMQPGGSVSGTMLFEVPADARDCVLIIRTGKEGATLASAEIPLP